jgi:protein SCO1/2
MAILRTLLASCLLLLLGGTALTVATDGFHAFTTETARRVAVRRHPPQVPPVPLETQAGTRINLTDLRGKWVLVDFIYTRCITYCQVLGGEFAQLQEQLAAPIAQDRLLLLSISFDPRHDTPAELAAYQARFRRRGAGWLAARPLHDDGLKQLLHTFGITVIPDTLGGYVHNTAIAIVNPQGRLVQILDMGDPQVVAKSVLQDIGQ